MPVQTVEEAARMLLAIAKDDHFPDYQQEDGQGFLEGAKAGILWQKEQGIEWISVDIEVPLPSSYETYSTDVLVLGGNRPQVTVYDFVHKRFIVAGYKATHWIYINLPKTDK